MTTNSKRKQPTTGECVAAFEKAFEGCSFEQLLRDSAKPTQVPETLAKYADALVKGTHEITSLTIRRKSDVLDRIIDSWQELEETMGHLRDENDVEGRMQISVIKKAWEHMDEVVREACDERGKL